MTDTTVNLISNNTSANKADQSLPSILKLRVQLGKSPVGGAPSYLQSTQFSAIRNTDSDWRVCSWPWHILAIGRAGCHCLWAVIDVQTVSDICKGSVPETLRNPKFTYLGNAPPPPTSLSRCITCVQAFAVSLCMFQMTSVTVLCEPQIEFI